MTNARHALITVVCLIGCSEAEPECIGHEDCAAGQICLAQSCEPGECATDMPCEDLKERCDLGTHQCGFKEGFGDDCDAERPCAFGEFCSDLVGLCYPTDSARDCTRRTQCPAAQICDRTANKCIPDPGCISDAFCEADEICDKDNGVCRVATVDCVPCGAGGVCEAGACAASTQECLASGIMSECNETEFCDPLGRCVQCTTNGQCGPGLYCNVATGKCDSNTQCADDASECPDSPNLICVVCSSPTVCNPRTKRCEAPATVCETDVDCPDEHFCDQTLDPPVCAPVLPDCLNDPLDEPPNQKAAQARLLPEADGTRFEALKLCQGDIDWYRLDVRAGTYLTVDARFLHETADIDMQLFLDDGTTLLDESRSTTDNERVEIEVGTDRVLLVRLFFAVPATTPGAYSLIITREAGRVCEDDDAEPNDGRAQAGPLVSDRPFDGFICAADPDWFVLRNVPRATRITAQLDFRDSLGNLDLELYRSDSSVPIQTASSMSDGETLSYDASFEGDYYLRVFGRAADTNVYTLRADLRANPEASCKDDGLEPNNGPQSAAILPAGAAVQTDLTICSEDQDWYALRLDRGDRLEAGIEHSSGADLGIKVFAANATRLASPLEASLGAGPVDYLAYVADTAGDYFLAIDGLRRADEGAYTLHTQIRSPSLCEPDDIDALDLGNTQDAPFSLGLAPLWRSELTLCNEDQDWWQVFLQAGFVHHIRLHYVSEDGAIDLSAYDPLGNLLASTTGSGVDVKEIAVTLGGIGLQTLVLGVSHDAPAQTPYSLVIGSTAIVPCSRDAEETNDRPAEATVISSSTAAYLAELPERSLCAGEPNAMTGGGDEDWYAITPVGRGSRMVATVEHAGGDLFLELLEPNGAERACVNNGESRCYSDGPGLAEHVSFTATSTSPYFLRVGSVFGDPFVPAPADANTAYDLSISVSAP